MITSKYILGWLEMVENQKIEACQEQHLFCKYVRRCFEKEDIYTDDDQLEKYIGLSKYFPFEQLYEWEEICLALHLCTFWKDTGLPRWPDLFLLIARGAGKDGYIAYESFCLTSPYSKLPRYDVDICAIAEEQAMRPVNDLLEVLDDTRNHEKLRKHYQWTKEKIRGIKFGGTIKGRTNNPRSKEGMRSGMVVFNEIHLYENYNNIKVFVAGLGKTMHPRRLYATTNGDVRDGPLDEMLTKSIDILKGEASDNGLLPFICRLDDKNLVHDKSKWTQANPSIIHNAALKTELEKQYKEWVESPTSNADFMTKRMNLPQSDSEVAVTAYENISVTNKELPNLSGWNCVVGIDYATVSDFASVNLHFKDGEKRYDINHSWLCLQSKDLERIRAPWREWANAGLLTVVDDVEIPSSMICEWLITAGSKYNIKGIALDNYRYALLRDSLQMAGFDARDKEKVHLVRPSDIMKIHPVIESVFARQGFIWGDNPVLRWATNNTKLVRSSKAIGVDTGNFFYAKIEARSRKTDPFMALVASMTIEDKLPATTKIEIPKIKTLTW